MRTDIHRVALTESDDRPLSFWRGMAAAIPAALAGWFLVAPAIFALVSCAMGALK